MFANYQTEDSGDAKIPRVIKPTPPLLPPLLLSRVIKQTRPPGQVPVPHWEVLYSRVRATSGWVRVVSMEDLHQI